MAGELPTLGGLLTFLAERAKMDPADYDFSALTQEIDGYSWTQGSGRQIAEPLMDLFDADIRPHDFIVQGLSRGSASIEGIATSEMVRGNSGDPPYRLKDKADGDLPRRVYVVYADTSTDQNPNVAMPVGVPVPSAGTVREVTLDMQTFAASPDKAQSLTERVLRRFRVGRMTAEFPLTRQRLAIEPGDVYTPVFDDRAWSMRGTKMTVGANGVVSTEWERDTAALAELPEVTGAPAQGHVPDTMPDNIATTGDVIDTALLIDAHNQSAPLAYLVAAPAEPGVWTGATFWQSETGELDSYASGWAGISPGGGSIMGTVAGTLPDAVPWVPDMGSSISVTLGTGALTAATLEDLLVNPALNLAAIRSGTGWELVQFMTPTLTAPLTYTITGFLRGVRGTEWAMAGHAPGDDFVLLDNAVRRTMGASEIGDTDWYIAAPFGQNANQDDAFALLFTGASHKPYAPVYAAVEQSGNDLLFDAVRRTRIGGASLNGQDVPLGESAESWSLDIVDESTSPAVVVRTITGSALPLNYTEAMQTADFGAPLISLSPAPGVTAQLYQVAPPLSLRGYPLEFPEVV